MRGKTTANTAADGTSITTISICAAVYADAAPTAIHLCAATCADVYAKGLCENQSRQHVASDRRHSEYRVLQSLWTIWRRHFVCVRFRFPVSDLLGLMIPMTVYSWRLYTGERPNTTTFAVCTLIFVNLISGILLLVSDKDA